MLTCTIPVTFRESKVDDKDAVTSSLSPTDEEIIGLDIAVDYSLIMNLLEGLDKLKSNVKHSFKVDLFLA